MHRRCVTIGFFFIALSTGCVSASVHHDAVREIAVGRVSAADISANAEAERVTCGELRAAHAQLSDELTRCFEQLAASEAQLVALQQSLEHALALIDQTSAEALVLAARLEQLAAVEEEMRQRNAIYQEFVARFQTMIDAGQLTVRLDRGRLVIELPQDILFDTGRALISPEGRTALLEIASVLASFHDRRFQVEGHTDNVPIRNERFPSNWELSTARSLAVVRLFLEAGVSPQNVSAAGYGEHQPRATNDSDAGRTLNRRIEIVMLPNLDILGNDIPGV